MANIKSAAKRARQSVVRRTHNASVLSALKTSQKKVQTALESDAPDARKTAASQLTSALDKAAKRGTIHKNLANRRKSRLAKAMAKSPPSA